MLSFRSILVAAAAFATIVPAVPIRVPDVEGLVQRTPGPHHSGGRHHTGSRHHTGGRHHTGSKHHTGSEHHTGDKHHTHTGVGLPGDGADNVAGSGTGSMVEGGGIVAEPVSESVTGAGGIGTGAGAGYIAVVGRSIPAKRGGPSCSELIKKCHDDIAIIVDKIG